MSDAGSRTRAKSKRSKHAVQRATAAGPSSMQNTSPAGGARLGAFYGAGPVLGLSGPVQTKVAIGQANDPFEREAEAVADRVTAGATVQPSAISSVTPGALAQTMPLQRAEMTQPEEKKPEPTPVQKAEARPPEQNVEDKTPLQRAEAKQSEEKKPESMPVQKAEAKPPEEKKPESMPVQKAEEKPPDQKVVEQKPVQKAEAKQPEEKKPEPPPEQKAEAKPPDQKVLEQKPLQKAEAKPPEEKKPEPMSIQKAEAKPPDQKIVEQKPVQKAEAKRPEEKKPQPSPVQKAEAKPPDQKVEENKPLQRAEATMPEEKKSEPTQVQRQMDPAVEPETEPLPMEDNEDTQIQTDASPGGGSSPSTSMAAVADHAISGKGPGTPLHPATRGALEGHLGADFGHVRVHDDSTARESARALNARAFTHGNDIWLGPGASQHDVHLMAHEATHVMQQSGGVQRQLIQRAQNPPATASGGPTTPEQAQRDLEAFPLPAIKARHRPVYEAWAAAGNLKRTKGYDRGEPDQKDSVWIPGVTVNSERLNRVHLDPSLTSEKTLTVPGGGTITGTYDQLLRQIKVPQWDRRGVMHANPLEVDHIVELQAGGWGSVGAANSLENMELLDKSSNASAGASTRAGIRRKVREYLRATGKPSDKAALDQYLNDNDVTFTRVEGGGGRSEGASQHWTKAEIEAGRQLAGVQPVRNPGQAGSATSFALLSPGGGIVLAEYPHAADSLTITIGNAVEQQRVAGLKITSIHLNEGYALAAAGAPIGTIEASWDLPTGVNSPSSANSFPITKSSAGQYAGVLGSLPPFEADLEGLSALRFDQVAFQGGMLSATGHLTPSIPLLEKVPIEVRLRGKNLEFVYYYRPEDLTLPIPGLSIDDASLGVFFGTAGLGIEGSVDVSIRNVGRGGLTARVDSSKNFEASGRFQFDTNLFDRAEIDIWYRNRSFGGSGRLAIEKPNKIRGIRSATITASFTEGAFAATGTVAPSIPGVREASLTVGYSEPEGLTIGGSLQLADNIPGISSGSLEAQVKKRPGEDRWVVSAQGTAVPKIPGVAASLSVTYDDGAFDVTGTVAYEKGMLKGSITVGATNRPVGEDGQPSGPPVEGSDKITLYGGGSLTLKLAPWLQATAAVKLLPNGEVEVTGEIGLPSSLDIFPEKRLDKNIFTIGIDIPIIGVAVAGQRIGIFANISGGLDLSAGIGPGQLQGLGLRVTYNPAHEEQTHVSGGATLHIPAHAGLRLFVRGGLGAGIPIVSAQAGLEIGGQLGLEGALNAGVQVDWTPTKGIVLDAFGEIYAEPKLKFDITGFVLVEADLLVTTVELYSKRWQLAAFEYGSGLRLGVKFPIHYEEGKPFDISLSDVQFQVPDINPTALLSDLVKRIA